MVILSILVPTTPDRTGEIMRLYKSISQQCGITTLFLDEGSRQIRRGYNLDRTIELIEFTDNRELTIGEKREKLYGFSNGLFSIQIDSDDDISDNAIELILKAIKENPDVDCVTFEERCQMNGQLYCSNHSLRYDDWEGDGSKLLSDGFHFHRTPFYKNVIKNSIAQSVPFEHIRFGEDHAWSISLKPHLKTEVHISKQLYYYIHEHNQTFEERYGLSFQ